LIRLFAAESSSYLLNNKSGSNATITFPKGDSHHAHKVILSMNSEIIGKALESSDSYAFGNEEDDSAAKSLIKFFYTGSIEYSDEASLVSFMILANKLKSKSIGELKVPAKAYFNGIIGYVEKDLNGRQKDFDSLCESVDFKKMEKEDLTKIYSKKKWLQKSQAFLNKIIMKDLEDEDGSESKSGSESGSSKSDSESGSESESKSSKSSGSESESKESEDDEEGGKLKFQIFDKNNVKITKKKIERFTGSDGYQIITSKNSVKKFKIKCCLTKTWMGVGVVSADYVKQKKTTWDTGSTAGTMFWSSNGYYWENNTSHSHVQINDNDICEIKVNKNKVSMKNLTTKSTVLDKTLPKGKYFPSILFYYVGSYVEVLK